MNLDLQIRKPDEVILVDSSEAMNTELAVSDAKNHVHYPIAYYQHERGLTKQRNFGVSRAKYEIIGFLDDDVLLEPDFFERILAIFAADALKEIGGASGVMVDIEHAKVSPLDEQLNGVRSREEFSKSMKEILGVYKCSPRGKLRNLINKSVLFDLAEEGKYCPKTGRPVILQTGFKGRKEVDFLNGVAFFRKEVFDKLSYSTYFEGYGLSEDLHFSLSVGKFYKQVVDGEAVFYHLHAPSGRPNAYRLGYMAGKNNLYVFRMNAEKRNLRSYFLYWYAFYMDAVIELLPAFLGQKSWTRIKHFFGKLHGSLAGLCEHTEI
jgi:glycosyltransferase involved in cell wall biosynthesis